MFYLSLTTGFGLRIDRISSVNRRNSFLVLYSSLTLHENCHCTLIGFSVMLLAIFMYRAGVGL